MATFVLWEPLKYIFMPAGSSIMISLTPLDNASGTGGVKRLGGGNRTGAKSSESSFFSQLHDVSVKDERYFLFQ